MLPRIFETSFGAGGGKGTVTVNASSPDCAALLSPQSAGPVDRAGGVGTFHVRTQAGCPWTATSSTPFIGLLNGAGKGPGAFEYCVAANRGADRSGAIAVAGRSIEIPQPGDDLPPGDCQPTSTSLCLLGALSNVDYVVTATDTTTGETQLYCNPSGTFRSVGDAAAFPRPGP